MSGMIEVMGVLLPQPHGADTVLRVRWFLREPGNGPDEFSFPMPEDAFRVELRNAISGDLIEEQVVRPHPFVMLDPPRTSQVLSVADDGTSFWNALPAQWPWQPVDPRNDVLDVDQYNTLALGITHLLGRSHPVYVEQRLRALALDAMEAPLSGMHGVISKDDMLAWAELFAAAFRSFPGRPRDLVTTVRTHLENTKGLPSLDDALPWLAPLMPASARALSPQRNLAALLQLLLRAGTEAARLADEARNVRALMALRAAQGGELIDYWCDYDKTSADQPSPVCPPDQQGQRIHAAQAMGLGLDFVLSTVQLEQELKVFVTQLRPPTVKTDAQYAFPDDGTQEPCAPGSFTLRKSWLRRAATQRIESHPPPPPSAFAAWVDYDFVSSYPVLPGEPLDKHLEDVMALAKPVTGDGIVSVQVARPAATAGFQYDYSFNAYCIWDGEVSGAVQKFFDDPSAEPTLAELKPFLLTRRYSYRRDIKEAFKDPQRIAALELLTRPMHEALLGLPDAIEQNGNPVPYPSKDPSLAQSARLTFSLRDLMPAQNAPAEVGWERQGGTRSDLYGHDPLWTVETVRPASGPLGADALPQRYRLWITAVDIFEQESAPIPVVGAEPGEADGSRHIFTPKWRSPPPAADSVECARTDGKLDITWTVAKQSLLGTAYSEYVRLPLDAHVLVARRAIRDVKDDSSSLTASTLNVNPLLSRRMAELQVDGWEPWHAQVAAVDPTLVRQRVLLDILTGDKGFEYLALVSHGVPLATQRFVQKDDVQTLRYLQQTEQGGQVGFEEIRWTIPATGPSAKYRNYPGFGAFGASQAVTILPEAGDYPPLQLEQFQATCLRAQPVLGVLGVNRDEALAKLIELKDSPQGSGISSAQDLMISTTLERLKSVLTDAPSIAMVREQLQKEFITQSAKPSIARSHPIIGFRGAARFSWRANRKADATPVVQYRIYCARMATEQPTSGVHARLANGVLDFDGAHSPLSGPQPSMIVLRGKSGAWTGLAAKDQRLTRVYGLCPQPPGDGNGHAPPNDELLEVHLVAGELMLRIPAATATALQDYVAALPVGGGYREYAAWWVVAVDCTNKEQWVDSTDGQPRMLTATLPPTIMPLPIASLSVRTPLNFQQDSPDPAQFDALRPFLPVDLLKEGFPLFPRTIVSWDAHEVAGREEYIFIERQTERDAKALTRDADPAWAWLKVIEAGPVGSPWNPVYEALRPWLNGGAPPIPGGEFASEHPTFFFGIDTPSAWQFKTLSMLRAPAANNAPSFIDYFDRPPGEAGGGIHPCLGEAMVRYRAYKVVDLMPELATPDSANFATRCLLSEPSTWTAWIKPEWPALTITHTATPRRREDGPLVRFSACSSYLKGVSTLRATAVDPFFFRLTLRRDVDLAFGLNAGRASTVSVGHMLQIPLAETKVSAKQITDDHSLERDEPFEDRNVSYQVTFELVWRQGASLADERVLRMFEAPYSVTATVPGLDSGVEARVDIDLTIQVG